MLMACLGTSAKTNLFETTTITGNEFAPNTTWYTLQLSAAGYYLSDNGTAAYIALTDTKTTFADKDLWCFTGNDTDGYTIYNKQAGTSKVLASPVTMSGTTGGTAYSILKAASSLGSTYVSTWMFEATNVLGEDTPAFWMYQKGNTANKVNNREGKFAFWTGGQDGGSAIQSLIAQKQFSINSTTGSFAASTSTFNSTWNGTDVPVRFNCGPNNMKYNGQNIEIYAGTALNCVYNLSATGYDIIGYSFDFAGEAGITLTTCDNQTFTTTAASQHLDVKGWSSEDGTATFTISGANKGIVLSNFVVYLQRTQTVAESQFDVFITTSSPNYRIPAIATTRKGTVVAIADYRYGGADIGYGSVELRRRTSTDNGKTWGDILEFTKGSYATSPKPKYDAAYGDPCIVADRTSDSIMVISCSGNTGFPNGTREVHQGIARFYSTDEGKSWSDPVNLESQFYALLDKSTRGPIRSMFIGSGRIFQSAITKVGQFYRLYCSGLVKDVNGNNINYVYYSDDFGATWNVLGDINEPPITSGDEPKAEEFPDGSILCSSRIGGGRRFNIFTFTDIKKGEGHWGKEAASTSANKGVIGPSCNGEIMIVPVTRNSDNQPMYLALHSTPASTSRVNVSIYYKGLPDYDAWESPAVFAANWEGKKQASKMGSAYSTMCMMANNHVGFLYEESTYGKDYTIVFKDYSIEQITDSAYSYNDTLVRSHWICEKIQEQMDSLFAHATGAYLGSPDPAKKNIVDEAIDKFRQSGNQDDYDNIAVEANKCLVGPDSTKTYVLESFAFSNYFLSFSAGSFSLLTRGTTETAMKRQEFRFVPTSTEGEWLFYHPSTQRYLQDSPSMVSKNFTANTDITKAGKYKVVLSIDGRTNLVSLNPGNASIPAFSASTAKKLIPGTEGNEYSNWLVSSIVPVGISDLSASSQQPTANAIYTLSGQRLSTPRKGLYIVGGQKIIY